MNKSCHTIDESAITRRRFLRATSTAGLLAAVRPLGFGAEPVAKLKGAVIGHTGRGDYGHGLESIFTNRPDNERVALADVFVRRATEWKAGGKSDPWEPFDTALMKSPPPHNLGPVSDWLEAMAKNREPECSGRNGAWAVQRVMAVYQAPLNGCRVAFPLEQRGQPLAKR